MCKPSKLEVDCHTTTGIDLAIKIVQTLLPDVRYHSV